MRIGLISDTHGLLRPEALEFLRGADHIIHAGDVGGSAIVEALSVIAPVTVVRGNNDRDPWGRHLPESVVVESDGVRMHVLHDLHDLTRLPAPAGTHAVVSGHSHRPLIIERGGLLHINPGSAGRRRFRLPVSCAELYIEQGAIVRPRIAEFDIAAAPRR